MDFQIKVIFVCFIINSVYVCNTSMETQTDLLDSLVMLKDNEINKLSFKDIFNLHHAFVIEDWKWEYGQISFKIDKTFDESERDKIKAAMNEIQRSSCIRFVGHHPRKYGPNYVMIKKFYDEGGLWHTSSVVGCGQQGEQILRIDAGHINEHQTILHALLITIGFRHHHQRSDRDKYIEFHLENTDLSEIDIRDNFAKKINFDPTVKYLTPFDFDSVMIYEEGSLSTNGESVITSKVEGEKMPTFQDRSRGLSKYDKILLNRLYDCPKRQTA